MSGAVFLRGESATSEVVQRESDSVDKPAEGQIKTKANGRINGARNGHPNGHANGTTASDSAAGSEGPVTDAPLLGGALVRDEFQNERGIKVHIDRTRDSLLTEFGKATLQDRYLMPEEEVRPKRWRNR